MTEEEMKINIYEMGKSILIKSGRMFELKETAELCVAKAKELKKECEEHSSQILKLTEELDKVKQG